jgi:Icc protein
MAYVIAQLSDIHIGRPVADSGERFSLAVNEINAMTRVPNLVLLTGDLTHNGSSAEWAELKSRLEPLEAPWEAIAGNHDRGIDEIAGHRVIDAGPLRLVLLDTSNDVFTEEDGAWLDAQLAASAECPTVIAIHQPPFETGIWWMDCVGLKHAERFEAVVRRHPQVIKVLSGHIHRLIQTQWDHCSLWVCPSTSVSIAPDLDSTHTPAETAEDPSLSLHAYTGAGIVSYLIPVGASAKRSPIDAPDFIAWARDQNATRPTVFTGGNQQSAIS